MSSGGEYTFDSMSSTPEQRIHRVRYAEEGQARYLTFSCFANRPFLRAERTCRWTLERLTALHAEGDFDLWAYVVMPTHCHVIILPHDPTSVPQFLYRWKKSVANRAVAWVQRHATSRLAQMEDRQPSGRHAYRFWQRGGGYDRNIITVGELHEKIRYIHANPVRWGLVDDPLDYQWSSARAWAEGVDGPAPIDRDTLPPLEV